AGEVGGRSPAEPDDDVLPGERRAAEAAPQLGEDRGGLGVLAVGDLRRVDLVARSGKGVGQLRGPRGEGQLVDEEDPARLGTDGAGGLRLEPAADEDLVPVLRLDGDPRLDHAAPRGRSSPRSSASAMSVARRTTGSVSVLTTSPATSA